MNTKFGKIIINILLCTTFALFYVHQRIEIIKTGFLINKHRYEVGLLLDQYRSLVYNLSQLESPKRVEDTLCVNEVSLSMPKLKNIHRVEKIDLAYSKEEAKPKTNMSFLANVFDRFSTKAEAKVVK